MAIEQSQSQSAHSQTLLSSIRGYSHSYGQRIHTLEDLLRYVQRLGLATISSSQVEEIVFLGQGASYKVYGCKERATGRAFAVKRVKLPSSSTTFDAFENRVSCVLQDIEIMNHPPLAEHKNLLRLIGYGWDYEQGDTIPYIATEWAAGGNLRAYLRSNLANEKDRLSFGGDVIAGIYELHLCGICHGDVKLENILVQNENPNSKPLAKVSDFGHSILVKSEDANVRSYKGTPGYCPPEIFSSAARFSVVDVRKCDLWAMGLTCWEILLNGSHYYETAAVCTALETLLEREEMLKTNESQSQTIQGSGTRSSKKDFRNLSKISHLLAGLAQNSVPVPDPRTNPTTALRSYNSGLFEELLNSNPFQRSAHAIHLPNPCGRPIPKATSVRQQLVPLKKLERQWDFYTFRPENVRQMPASAKKKIFQDFQLLSSNRDPEQAARANLQLAYSYAIGFGVRQNLDKFEKIIAKCASDGLHVAQALAKLVQIQSRGFHSLASSQIHYSVFRHYLLANGVAHQVDPPEFRPTYDQLLKAGGRGSNPILNSTMIPPPISAIYYGISNQIPFDSTVNNRHPNTGDTALTIACKVGDSTAANNLLDRGADISISDLNGCLPIHWLCMFEKPDIGPIATRLTQDWRLQHINTITTAPTLPDPQSPLFLYGTPLAFAVRMCSITAVETLVKLGADPLAKENDSQGITAPLELAIALHQTDIIEILWNALKYEHHNAAAILLESSRSLLGASAIERRLIHGTEHSKALERTVHWLHIADLSSLDERCSYLGPLSAAASLMDLQAARTLLDDYYGPSQFIRDQFLFICIYEVCEGALEYNECTTLLDFALSQAANVNAESETSGRPIDILIDRHQGRILTYWLSSKCPAVSQIFAPPRQDSFYPLYDMINNGLSIIEPIDSLLMRDGSINDQKMLEDGGGPMWETPLHLATRRGLLKNVVELLKYGADPGFCDSNGLSPFSDAIGRGKLDLIRDMIPYMKEINALDRNGETALQVATRQDNTQIAEVLLQHGSSATAGRGDNAIHTAAAEGHVRSLRLLLSYCHHVEIINEHGYTPLHLALRSRRHECIPVLLDAGADPNVYHKEISWPVHMVLRYFHQQRLTLVKCLRQKGARLDVLSNEGTTLLHLASYLGDFPLVKYLINEGLSVTSLGGHRQTPLHDCIRWTPRGSVDQRFLDASIRARCEIVELLISTGSSAPWKPFAKDLRNDLELKTSPTEKDDRYSTDTVSQLDYNASLGQDSISIMSQHLSIPDSKGKSKFPKKSSSLRKKPSLQEGMASARDRVRSWSGKTGLQGWLHDKREHLREENKAKEEEKSNIITGRGITLFSDDMSRTPLDLAALRTADNRLLKHMLFMYCNIVNEQGIELDIEKDQEKMNMTTRLENAEEHRKAVNNAWGVAIENGCWLAVEAFLSAAREADSIGLDLGRIQFPHGGRFLLFAIEQLAASEAFKFFVDRNCYSGMFQATVLPGKQVWPGSPPINESFALDLRYFWTQTIKLRRDIAEQQSYLFMNEDEWQERDLGRVNLADHLVKINSKSRELAFQQVKLEMPIGSWHTRTSRQPLKDIWRNVVRMDFQAVSYYLGTLLQEGNKDDGRLRSPQFNSNILMYLILLVGAYCTACGTRAWVEKSELQSHAPNHTSISLGLISEVLSDPCRDGQRVAKLVAIVEDYRDLGFLAKDSRFHNYNVKYESETDRGPFEKFCRTLVELHEWLARLLQKERQKPVKPIESPYRSFDKPTLQADVPKIVITTL